MVSSPDPFVSLVPPAESLREFNELRHRYEVLQQQALDESTVTPHFMEAAIRLANFGREKSLLTREMALKAVIDAARIETSLMSANTDNIEHLMGLGLMGTDTPLPDNFSLLLISLLEEYGEPEAAGLVAGNGSIEEVYAVAQAHWIMWDRRFRKA